MLDEAERKTKRSLRAASLYKDEIARLNPAKKTPKKRTAEAEGGHVMGLESIKKEGEIERMSIEIEKLKAEMNKGKTKVCVIS